MRIYIYIYPSLYIYIYTVYIRERAKDHGICWATIGWNASYPILGFKDSFQLCFSNGVSLNGLYRRSKKPRLDQGTLSAPPLFQSKLSHKFYLWNAHVHVNGFNSSEGVVLPVRHGRFSGCPFHMLVMACAKVDARTNSALGACRISLLVAQGCSGPIRISLAHLSALGNPIGTTLEHNCVTTLCVCVCVCVLDRSRWRLGVKTARETLSALRACLIALVVAFWYRSRNPLHFVMLSVCVCVSVCWVGLVMERCWLNILVKRSYIHIYI